MSRSAPPLSTPRARGARARRAAAAVAGAAVGALVTLAGGGTVAAAAPTASVVRAASTASVASVAQSSTRGAPATVVSGGSSLATTVRIPSACRATMTVVRPDGTLAMGVVQGAKATLYSTGHRLTYRPKAVAYLGNTTSRGAETDRFFVTDSRGRMHRVTVSQRTGSTTVDVTDTVVANGWGNVRLMVATGPYLYAVTTGGSMRRYAVSATYGLTAAGSVGSAGWGNVTSLAYGGWWRLPGGARAEDLVAVTRGGALKAFVVPRNAPAKVTQRTLVSSGWGKYRHVAAGECTSGRSRALVAVRANGDVHAFLDGNGDDQSGADISSAGRVATGWRGTITD